MDVRAESEETIQSPDGGVSWLYINKYPSLDNFPYKVMPYIQHCCVLTSGGSKYVWRRRRKACYFYQFSCMSLATRKSLKGKGVM